MKNFVIETQRLYLRQWKPSDLTAFAAMNADPEVMKYFPKVLNTQESNLMAQAIMAQIEHNGWGFWAVEVKKTGSFAGFTGLNVPKTNLPFSPCMEIGWRLRQKYWGKGYATEAACAALDFAFNQLQLTEVVSFTAQINQKSRKVMERIGMPYQGETFEHPAIEDGHALKRHVLYRISCNQWRDQSRSLRENVAMTSSHISLASGIKLK